jgi:hypothetical protein
MYPLTKKLLFLIPILFITTVFFFTNNKSPNTPSIKLSYYHWAQTYKNNTEQINLYAPHQLYIKLLDIGYRKKLIINPTRLKEKPITPITPVVFLDNTALKQTSVTRLYQLITQHIPYTTYQRLQMDCDWSLTTRDKYFALLKRLTPHYPELSATLRLHQIKYFKKTGVPPVKRAVLMYYNMSDIHDINTENYVLDHTIGKRYFVNFEHYPLALDLALPLYQQIRVIRQHKLVLLLQGATLNHTKLKMLSKQRYKVLTAHYYQGHYLYKNDELIVDSVNQHQLTTVTQDLARLIKPHEVIFYKFSDAKRFSPQTLKDIVHFLE